MNPDLAAFLARHTAFSEGTAVWADGTMPLRERLYFSRERPPLEYITSVRSLVFKDHSVLVLKNRHSTHILPGGRREPGETLDETLRREILEESGWTISGTSLLGFVHFHHLKPKPPGYRYPHPDFLQVVYASDAVAFFPGSKLPDDYETEARFQPIDRLKTLGIEDSQMDYLDAALKARE